jgi:NADH-quinone oxidoreductase subunit J
MDLTPWLFWITTALTSVAAIGVVVTQNIVRAAAWLLFALGGTAGIFFLLGADFVGATQLLVYVGGTLVLVVFGVMLTAQGPFISMKIGSAEWAIALVVGVLLYGVIAFTALRSGVASDLEGEARAQLHGEPANPLPQTRPSETPAATSQNSELLGAAFLGVTQATPERTLTGVPGTLKRTRVSYLLPFEIVSVHLLVVLVGAAYLARAKRRRGAVS